MLKLFDRNGLLISRLLLVLIDRNQQCDLARPYTCILLPVSVTVDTFTILCPPLAAKQTPKKTCTGHMGDDYRKHHGKLAENQRNTPLGYHTDQGPQVKGSIVA